MDFLVLRCGMSAEADRNQARLIQKTNQDSGFTPVDCRSRAAIFEETTERSSPFNGLTAGTQEMCKKTNEICAELLLQQL